MIQRLYIRNYALIDSLDMDFSQGFSVITGETGAGKSIILGALSLILGQRVDTKVVTDTNAKTIVEATFGIEPYNLQPFFEENDLEYDANYCIIRREIAPNGKSRAFINDSPVTLTLLKQLTERLIDIHSQHQNLLLADSSFQLRLLDVMARNDSYLATYQKAHNRCIDIARQLDEARRRLDASRADEDYIRFQYQQLFDARLVDGELEELQAEQERLSHAGDIKEALYTLDHLLQADESGVLASLRNALTRARAIQEFFPEATAIVDRIESTHIELKDIALTFAQWNESLTDDPQRLLLIEQRLDTLNTLLHKHRADTVARLIELRDNYEQQLHNIDNSDEALDELKRQLDVACRERKASAAQLTQSRAEQAKELASRLADEVRPLGMPHVQVAIDLVPVDYYNMGAEQVVIRFSANKNQPLQPLSEVASGGEISRLMLCVKALVAHTMALPTIIFDEIDTGVSGDIAARMGDIMRRMAHYMQVIAITHLPQVAAIGQHHYHVYKDSSGDATHTHLSRLNDTQRVEELARLLSGTTLTAAALDNARALLTSNTL